jgi:hypothetical protein
VKVSRIGIGLPSGGAVEFADMSTLTMSMNARREVADTGVKTEGRSPASMVDI